MKLLKYSDHFQFERASEIYLSVFELSVRDP